MIKRILYLLFALFVAVAIGGKIYLWLLVPKYEGRLNLPDLSDSVAVYFDEFGVPHIRASSAGDAYRSLGYLHARERMFQIELMRRAGQGRLSEVLGEELLPADILFRTLGVAQHARQAVDSALVGDSLTRVLAQAYCDGVNHYLTEAMHAPEFVLLGIEPEPYTLYDIYCVAGYMSYSFAFALREDPLIQSLNDSLGVEFVQELVADFSSVAQNDSAEVALQALWDGKGIDLLPVPVLQGSNTWAVAPHRSAGGKAMLCNDTHIKFGLPSVWYEAALSYPGFESYGFYLGGIPFPLVAHTPSHAWGLTMFENDDFDLFQEQWADSSRTELRFNDSLRVALRHRAETIAIRGREDTVLNVFTGAHGPLVNHLIDVPDSLPVSGFWLFTQEKNYLLSAFRQLLHAGDMAEFQQGVERIHAPGLNVSYADSAGHIALWSAGRLPKRTGYSHPHGFLEGWSGRDEYAGYFNFEANPQNVDPPSGIIYNGNNAPDATAAGSIPGYYAPPYRAERIGNHLNASEKHDHVQMEAMLMDHISTAAGDHAAELIRIVEQGGDSLSATERAYLTRLKSWKGRHHRESELCGFYYDWCGLLSRKLLLNKLSEDQIATLVASHLWKNALPQITANPQSVWWDNPASQAVETRRLVTVDAFRRVVQWHEDSRERRAPWGERHKLHLKHPLGSIALLKPVINAKALPAPGGNETVNNAGFPLDTLVGKNATYGPQMRRIIDFSNFGNNRTVSPGGQSGIPASPYYTNQVAHFVDGTFRPMISDSLSVLRLKKRLILYPN